MFRIGVTGGIGSGKSTICNLFASYGIATIDADQIAHSLTAANGAAISAIAEQFGSEVIDAKGALDRTKMRELVFIDPQARHRLEGILHPLIRKFSDEAANQASGPYVLFGIPLLVEGLRNTPLKSDDHNRPTSNRFDRILVVDCLPSEQLVRVQKRSKLSESAVLAIMQAQATRAERLKWANDVVLNFDGQTDCEAQVSRLHHLYLAMANGPLSI
jgi:dephospho-CoA kinase